MFIRLIKKEQIKLIKTAIKKAGSERKLSKLLNIPNTSFYHYKFDQTALPIKRFNKIISFLKINKKDIKIKEYLPQNWRQRLGGKKCVEVKKANGTFNKNMRQLKLLSSKRMKSWHSIMKRKEPEKYYTIQYNRFKKIGGYKYRTKKGEAVRNKFEKEIADILINLNIEYQYEPLVRIKEKFYFPDFLINNSIIIESTMWRGVQKSYELKNKINNLKKKYKVFVVIPKTLYSYYKIINPNLILGLDNFASVAQTFPKKGATGRASDC